MELIVNEQTVFFSTAGQTIDPSRETVLFVHGAGQDHSIWVLAGRYFARHHQNVISVDLPGHGRSEGPPLTSIGHLADWLRLVMSEAGIASATIIGHSMGSLVALVMAARYPEQVKAIAMVGTAVPMPVSDTLLESARANDDAAVQMLTLWGHSASAHLGGSPTPGLWMLNCGTQLMRQSDPDVLFADLSACQDYATGMADAGSVECPTLLILGQRDVMTPVGGTKELSESLVDSSTIVIPGAGHALLAECPDAVLDALITIVEGT